MTDVIYLPGQHAAAAEVWGSDAGEDDSREQGPWVRAMFQLWTLRRQALIWLGTVRVRPWWAPAAGIRSVRSVHGAAAGQLSWELDGLPRHVASRALDVPVCVTTWVQPARATHAGGADMMIMELEELSEVPPWSVSSRAEVLPSLWEHPGWSGIDGEVMGAAVAFGHPVISVFLWGGHRCVLHDSDTDDDVVMDDNAYWSGCELKIDRLRQTGTAAQPQTWRVEARPRWYPNLSEPGPTPVAGTMPYGCLFWEVRGAPPGVVDELCQAVLYSVSASVVVVPPRRCSQLRPLPGAADSADECVMTLTVVLDDE